MTDSHAIGTQISSYVQHAKDLPCVTASPELTPDNAFLAARPSGGFCPFRTQECGCLGSEAAATGEIANMANRNPLGSCCIVEDHGDLSMYIIATNNAF